MRSGIEALQHEIRAERDLLLQHPIYQSIRDLEGLQKFTGLHVFAVWDFMSLLKSLQIGLTSVSIPWRPVGAAETRYLINEIVLGEESDVDEYGRRISHFELYVRAMEQMGASTAGIHALLQDLESSGDVIAVIEKANIHPNIKAFLSYTFEIVLYAPLHVKAAVFTFGREDLIPSMFMRLLEQLYVETPGKVSTFKYYVERHIEVDGDHHSKLAIDMVSELCGDDESKWTEAASAAKKALQMRYLLWDSFPRKAIPADLTMRE
jgi:hypothetical protein